MGRVFFNTRKHIHKLTADYTCLESDSNKVFIVLPAATTEITLPTTLVEGWNCKVILQADDGFGGDELMDNIVNIDMGSGTANVGQIHGHDTATSDQAVSGDDYINCSVDASPGDTFEFMTDGTRWFVLGHVFDASTTPFAASAAS